MSPLVYYSCIITSLKRDSILDTPCVHIRSMSAVLESGKVIFSQILLLRNFLFLDSDMSFFNSPDGF